MTDKYIIEGEPDEDFLSKIPRKTVGKHIWEMVIKHDPESVAEIEALTKKSITYGKLIDQGKSLCKTFAELGCGPEDIIVVSCGNDLSFTPCYLGCLWNGNPIAPIYDGFALDDYEHILKKYNAKVIIANTKVYPHLKQVYKNLNKELKFSSQFIVILNPEDDPKDYKDCLIFSQCINKSVEDNASFKPFEVPESELEKHCCTIMPSSGSTGYPKGVRHSEQSAMYGLYYVNTLNDNFKSILTITGGYWQTGINSRYYTLSTGGLNILLTFEPELFLKSIEKYKAEFIFLSPGYFGLLMKYDWTKYDTTSLKCTLYGGGKISEEIIKISDQKTKCKKLGCYGMTECNMVHNPINSIPGSNGKLFPGVKAKVISIESGESLPPNKNGELCLKSKSLFQGYHNNPEATAESMDSEGWLHSGDMVYYTEEGQFFIVDRIKSLIKYQSLHVNSTEIEGLISNLDDVIEVCVVGIHHPIDWEHAKAFVVRKPNSKITENEIVAHVKDKMPEYKWLHGGVQFVDALPKTITGKYLRNKIREMHKTTKE